MKTEAIRKCIKTEDIVNSIAAQGAVALAELEAIETALAAKDVALQLSAQLMEQGQYMCLDDDAVLKAQETVKAALSPPTGKVLVDLEKLRKLADGFHGTDGIEIGLCPVCAKKERHDDNCWLDNALKENDA